MGCTRVAILAVVLLTLLCVSSVYLWLTRLDESPSAVVESVGEDGEEPPAARPPGKWRPYRGTAADQVLSLDDQERMERLLALGYLAGSVRAPDDKGVTFHVRDAAYPGFNFVLSGHGPEAFLMDMEGNVLHRWRRAFREIWPDHDKRNWYRGDLYWRRAHLFPNGDVLAIFDGLGLIKIDESSNLLWAYSGEAHHDLSVAEGGSIYVLTHERTIIPRISPTNQVFEDFITVLDAHGNEIRKVSLFESVANSSYAFLLEKAGKKGDIFHTNTIEVLDGRLEHLSETFEAGNVLVSIHGLHAVGVVDLDAEEMVWGMTGSWKFQHQPTLLDNGNILLFDNLGTPGRSSVLEVEPFNGETVWVYQAERPDEFFSFSCGTSERLPNGNTLITESDNGRAIEVTPDKKIVWEYVNPHRAGENDELIATLFEVVRLPLDFPLDWTDGGAPD
jgi:hypothetical protein